jgi:hypothetical protein
MATVDVHEQVKEHTRRTALTNNDRVDTCAILPRSKGGAAAPRLRVYGA